MRMVSVLAETNGNCMPAERLDEQRAPAPPLGRAARDIEACLARIEARDPTIRAWAHVGGEQARAEACRLDMLDQPKGEFHGVPIGVKDVIATADMPTADGHRAHRDRILLEDAACVRRARDAGAVVVGKTATAEFALSAPPITRHPLALMRSPGGSSAGSAAAVAAGMVPIALATQTGGSAIRPASYCGVVGFKPGFGLIDRSGVLPLSPSFDTVAVIGRTVDLAARFAGAIADRPWRPHASARGLRIGLYASGTMSDLLTHPLVSAALAAATTAFQANGASVRRIEPQREDNALRGDHATIVLGEARGTLARYLDDPTSRLRAATRRVFAAPTPSPVVLSSALERADHARGNADRWFGGTDVLLAPAVTGPAPRRGGAGDPSPCIVWTVLHLPCMTLPTNIADESRLLIGVQLIARAGAEALLIEAARLLECVFDARRRLRTQQ